MEISGLPSTISGFINVKLYLKIKNNKTGSKFVTGGGGGGGWWGVLFVLLDAMAQEKWKGVFSYYDLLTIPMESIVGCKPYYKITQSHSRLCQTVSMYLKNRKFVCDFFRVLG